MKTTFFLSKSIACFVLLFFFFTSGNAQMRQVYSDLVNTYNDIQKVSFYSGSSGYIASTQLSDDWVGFTSDSGRTITRKFITSGNVNLNGNNVSFGFDIRGVKAFSQDTLLAYGSYGLTPAILYSTNGGTSYLLIYHSLFGPTNPSQVYDMVFPENNNIGFATDGYRILKTTDRGQSWFPQITDGNATFDALDAIDNNNVYCFSRFADGSPTGRLMKTSNSGSSWQQVNIPDNHIHSVDFITTNKGWLSVYHNTDSMLIYYTANGGNSWIKKNHREASPVLFEKMQFINDSTGFAIGEDFTTYATSDTGRVWEPIQRDNNFSYQLYGHNDIQVRGSTQLWSGGARDFLEINTNLTGPAIPKAYFLIDTNGVNTTGNVKLVNYSKRNYQYKWFVNNVQVSTSYDHVYTHSVSSPVDSVVLIVINGALTDTVKKYQNFVVPNLPVITSFSPASGSVGTSVTIKGSALAGVTSVKFGGINASSFTIINDNTIRAIVAGGATGAVSVTDIHGTYSLPTFTYFAVPASQPPVITSFSPRSGIAGTSITITGQNFGAAAANNRVQFGAVSAAITSATATQIVCTVPAGASYEPFSVLNSTTNLRGASQKPFNVTFDDSSNFTTHSFVSVYTYDFPAPYSPRSVGGSDMDNDGKPDLVFGKSISGDSLGIMRNTSPGGVFSFASPQIIGLSGISTQNKFTFSDIDGDGRNDILCATNINYVLIHRNLSSPGALSFAPPFTVESADGPQEVSANDLDKDGRPDLAVAGFNGSRISIIRNTSSPGYPSFAYKIDLVTGGNTVSCATGDLDGDGLNDLVTLNSLTGGACNMSWFKNQSTTGAIAFGTHTDIALPSSVINSKRIFLCDYDNDGRLDVIITNSEYNIFIRNTSSGGTISFATPITNFVVGFVYAGDVANLSGDEKPDLLYGKNSFSNFTLLRNISPVGTIANDPPVDNDGSSRWLNCADFNLDGKQDIAITTNSGTTITVYKNNIGVPIPFTLTTVAACAGSTQQRTSDVAGGTTFQWQQNTGTGFVNITNNAVFSGAQSATLSIANIQLAWNGYLYRCVVDGGTYYSSTFILNVQTSATPVVSINSSATSICAGATVTFNATATNTGPLSHYQWQVNGVNAGTDSPVFTTNTLTNGAQVKVLLTSICSSAATSNTITMTVTGETPSVSISTASTTACINSSVTFTAIPVNPGTSPSYQWQVNGVNAGTNSITFTTSSLTNGAQVKVIMTTAPTTCGTNAPVTSNIITMNITNPATPTVTILSTATTICQGQGVNFNVSSSTSPGSSPSYQWQARMWD